MQALCQSFDRLDQIRAEIETEDIVSVSPSGIRRASGLLKSEHEATNRALNLWKALSFEAVPPTYPGVEVG